VKRDIDRIDLCVESSVNTEFDVHIALARLDVDIRGTRFHRVVDYCVDELYDRRHLSVVRELVEVQHFLALLGLADQRDLKARRGLRKNALGGITLPQYHVDRTGGRDIRHDTYIQDILKFIETLEVRRVGHCGVEVISFTLDRHELVPQHQVDGYASQFLLIERRRLVRRQQVDERHSITPCKRFCLDDLRRLVRVQVVDRDRRSGDDSFCGCGFVHCYLLPDMGPDEII
jgi:hypothetical protein